MASQAGVKAGHAFILVEALDKTAVVFRGLENHLNMMSQRFLFLGKQAAILGAALSVPLLSSLNSARDFSDEMLFLQSVLGATDKQMDPLSNKIKTLGRTTSYTATEVAKASTALAQGGFSIDKIIKALPATLNMARGARMELGQTADILVDTLTLFEMEADRASEVADKFFLAARRGTIDVADLAQSFSYTALSANEMGFSLDETLSILSEMSKRMLKATKAGTSLNQFITSLASRIEKVREKIKIEIFDPSGEPRNGLMILKDFADSIKKMSTEKKIPIIEEVFNVRGARAAVAIAKSIEGIFDSVKEMGDSAGIAEEAAKKMDSGIGGSIRRMLASVNLLKIEVGLAMEEMLQKTEATVGPIIRGITIWAEKNKLLFRDITKAVLGINIFSIALLSLGITTRVVAIALGGLRSILNVLMIPLKLLQSVATTLGSVLLALTGQVYHLIRSLLILGGRALLLPVILVGRLASVTLSVTRAIIGFIRSAISLSITITRLVARSIAALISGLITVTGFILRETIRAFGLFMDAIQLIGTGLRIAGTALLKFGFVLFDVGIHLIGKATNMVVTFIGSIFALASGLTAMIGGILTAIGSLLTVLSPFIAVGIVVAVIVAAMMALSASIVAVVKAGRMFGDMIFKITDSMLKISDSIIGLAQTAVSFVGFLVKNSLPSLLTFITEVFGGVVRSGQRMWKDLEFTAISSWGRIRKLIESGDMEGALKVAMRSLRFIWDSTVIEMQIIWKKFTAEGKILFSNLTMEANIAWMTFQGKFRAGVDEIYKELENIADAVTKVFGVLFGAIAKVYKFIDPIGAALSSVIADALGDLSTESKALFDAIREGQRLDKELRDRQGPTPQELEIEAQVKALRDAQRLLDLTAQYVLQGEIDKLLKLKEALKPGFIEDIKSAPIGPFPHVKDPGLQGGLEPPGPLQGPDALRKALEEAGKFNTTLPGALEKGSTAAHQKSYENQQISLLSSIAGGIQALVKQNKNPGAAPPPVGPGGVEIKGV